MNTSRLRVCRHIRSAEMAAGNRAVWNAFFPAVAAVDARFAGQLVPGEPLPAGLPRSATRKLRALRLVHSGENEPCADDFFRAVDEDFTLADQAAARFQFERQAYGRLTFTNTACNLSCGYCVARRSDRQRRRLAWRPHIRAYKRRLALAVLDQYLARCRTAGQHSAAVGFNGGEILLEWPLIRELLEHAHRCYTDLELRWDLNTNMTLMTPEIAAALKAHGVHVYISIDGYREAHDRARRYHHGTGSFDDVLRGVAVYNAAAPQQPITAFQGTIAEPSRFDVQRLFAMRRHGFVEARLAPNLLGVSTEEAHQAAHLHADLFERSQRRGGLVVSDTWFSTVYEVVNHSPERFSFYCTGLCGLPSRVLTYNLDTTELSHLCGFISAPTVPWETVFGDIHHPALWEAARSFLAERLAQLRRHCAGCDVVGVCRGGCVMNGLGLANEVNEAACAYQRMLWQRMLAYARPRRRRPTAHARRGNDEVPPLC